MFYPCARGNVENDDASSLFILTVCVEIIDTLPIAPHVAARETDMTAAAYEYAARKARARNRRINLFCAFMCAIGVASLVGQVWL